MAPANNPSIIGISGPSSSGKTTLARLLQTVFSGLDDQSNLLLLHEDDFYLPDNRIPITASRSGDIQDWDCILALDTLSLARTLEHVKRFAALPPRLRSIQDLNEAGDSGVSDECLERIRERVRARLLACRDSDDDNPGLGLPRMLVLLEGFLLFSPPVSVSGAEGQGSGEDASRRNLRSVHDTLDLRLFLPAPYDMVKARRESRSGYVTAGPAPTPLPQRRSSVSSDKARDEEGGDPDLLKEEEEKDRPQQNFWTDPPGYVDDVVWPRYVRDHAWLLAGENGEDLTRIDDEGELIRLAGQGTHVNPDVAGVKVAPGQGRLSMAEVLQWAADEVVGHLVSR